MDKINDDLIEDRKKFRLDIKECKGVKHTIFRSNLDMNDDLKNGTKLTIVYTTTSGAVSLLKGMINIYFTLVLFLL